MHMHMQAKNARLRVLTQQLAKIIQLLPSLCGEQNFGALTRRLRHVRSSGRPEGMG